MAFDDIADKVREKHSKKSKEKTGSQSETEIETNDPVDDIDTMSSTGSGGKSKGSFTQSEVKQDLFGAVARIYNLTRALEQEFDNKNIPGKRKMAWKQVSRDIHETAFEHFGVFGGHAIAQKYGIDWEMAISEMKIGGGNDKKMSADDAEKLMKVMANAQIKAEGIVRKEKDDIEDGRDSEKKRVRLIAADQLYNDISAVLREHNVQRHAERFGIDYEEDVIMDILEGQSDYKKDKFGS